MRKIISLCLVACMALCSVSCSSEAGLADSYLNKFKKEKKSATEQIYVCLPKEVMHTNSSLNDIEDFPQLSEKQQDSVIASLTAILDKVNDSLFLSRFNQSLLYYLSRANIPVVVVNDESLLPVADSQHFTFNVVQLEAEEYLQQNYCDFSTRSGAYYKYGYDLRHFSVNAWVKMDAHDTVQTVYFKNQERADKFHGTVTQIKDGKATLNSHFDRIGVNDAYSAASVLAYSCATAFINRILNNYIKSQKGTPTYYYYYDPVHQEVYATGDSFEEGEAANFLKTSE